MEIPEISETKMYSKEEFVNFSREEQIKLIEQLKQEKTQLCQYIIDKSNACLAKLKERVNENNEKLDK